LTGLPGRLGQFVFLKNQYDVVLEKKKQNSTMATGFLTGSCRVNWPGQPVHTGFFSFSCFFFNPTRFQPRVGWVPDRPAGPGQVLKL
jgi:hypothetical protein